MQIESLKVFCDLVESGSFTRSAVINGVTQSAVSQQISALERNFKSLLLERKKGVIHLTPKGKTLYDQSKKVLVAYGILMKEMGGESADGARSRAVAESTRRNASRVVDEATDPNDPKI